MAKNDAILVDGIIDQRVAEVIPSSQRDEVFEYFAFEQVLKHYDLSSDELESGWVDGKDDGGIDGFFTFVNGNLVRDIKDFAWPKVGAEIAVWILTCKHHDTFKQAPLDSLCASVSELFDFTVSRSHFKGAYSVEVANAREIFHAAYRRLASANPSLAIHYRYASRGDTTSIGENIKARGSQIVELTRSFFSSSNCSFEFVGASELVSMYRKTKKFSIELPVVEMLSHGKRGYVVLAGLKQYYDFITDESGNLRRYLFDSNVRDYLGRTQVNEDISETLKDHCAPDFWWLNNGVTILTTDARAVGKTLNLTDIQIVNGLQTTESIYTHFSDGGSQPVENSVMIKVIVSNEISHRDQIIRATNNQNIVDTSGLRATDKVQRDIEEYLEKHGWYYERRKNYYKNVGKPPERFVMPVYLAAGFVSLAIRHPERAANLRARFMRVDQSYDAIFSVKTDLRTWVVIVETLKRTEMLLRSCRPMGGREGFLRWWRNLVAFIAVAKIHGSFVYGIGDLLKIDPQLITSEMIVDIWSEIQAEMGSVYIPKLGKNREFVSACCTRASASLGISHAEAFVKEISPKHIDRGHRTGSLRLGKKSEPNAEFLALVDANLPNQPWKPGIHTQVASKLGCKPFQVSAAIGALIASGRRNEQRDGVVFGKDGTVISRDIERFPDVSQPDS